MQTSRSHETVVGVARILALTCLPALGCSDDSAAPEPLPYLRSDSPELKTGWQATMPVYLASHQNEQAVVQSLALDSSARTLIDPSLNRVSFTTPTGTVQVFYDEGVDKPFHTLNYLRSAPFQAQTFSGSADLRAKWDAGARLAVDYLKKLTRLTPVVVVGRGADADYAAALTDGYQIMLAVEGRLLWVEDLEVRVDAQGIYEFSTDELAFDATPDGTVDCFTQAEVQAIHASAEYPAPDPSLPPPIFYGFDTVAERLYPFYLAVGTGDAGSLAIPLDRNAAN